MSRYLSKPKFKVTHLQDNTYQVQELDYTILTNESNSDGLIVSSKVGLEARYSTVYQGSISDCEAFIRLKEKGYL